MNSFEASLNEEQVQIHNSLSSTANILCQKKSRIIQKNWKTNCRIEPNALAYKNASRICHCLQIFVFRSLSLIWNKEGICINDYNIYEILFSGH